MLAPLCSALCTSRVQGIATASIASKQFWCRGVSSNLLNRLFSVASIARNADQKRGFELKKSEAFTEMPSPTNRKGTIREDWGMQIKSNTIIRDCQPYEARLRFLMHSFKKELASFSSNAQHENKTKFCIISAWLLSDNVIVDLFYRSLQEESNNNISFDVIAIDTLHLFPETFQTFEMMEARYPNLINAVTWIKPEKCVTREDFNQLHGHFHRLPEAEFDYWTKVQPLQHALETHHELLGSGRSYVVSGRRNDQGHQRLSIPVWEQDKSTFNPLVNWTWNDVTLYCQHFNVPVNPLHRRIYIDPLNPFIARRERDAYKNFLEIQLDYPYFYYNEDVLRKAFSHRDHRTSFYVWKSLGDTVTSVPVSIDEGEREGRFVHRLASECGIHTRVSNTKKAPHGGGRLVKVLSDERKIETRAIFLESGVGFDRIAELNERQVCDLELLLNGGYSPLEGFMTQLEYESCIQDMRLPEGSLWGLPIVLDSHDENIEQGHRLLLRSSSMGGDLAIMAVESVWKPDKTAEALCVFNTTSRDHPYIDYMKTEMGPYYVGGPIVQGIRLPERSWLPSQYRVSTPTEVVVHPSIGPSKQDDFDAKIRVPTYEVLRETLRQRKVNIYYFPYHMRLGGPREMLQHLICRKNYGFTQMIVGRDHAGCKDAAGRDFYGPYEAQELAEKYAPELGIKPISFKQLVYVPERRVYMEIKEAQSKSLETRSISGTEFRRRINSGSDVPSWYAFPEVIRLLEASIRYHSTKDSKLPWEIAAVTRRPVVVVYAHVLSPSSTSLDADSSERIISISKQYPGILFFVLLDGDTTSRLSLPLIEMICMNNGSSENGDEAHDADYSSTHTSSFSSFDELENHLKTL